LDDTKDKDELVEINELGEPIITAKGEKVKVTQKKTRKKIVGIEALPKTGETKGDEEVTSNETITTKKKVTKKKATKKKVTKKKVTKKKVTKKKTTKKKVLKQEIKEDGEKTETKDMLDDI
jgi:hypothetical protein